MMLVFAELVVLVIKSKILMVDVEETFPSDSKEKVSGFTSASVADQVVPLSRYTQVTHVALSSLGALLVFEPL